MRVEVCASVLARACKSAAQEVVAANGRVAGSPGPSAQESCIDVTGRERCSPGAGQRPQRGPGLSRSLEPGIPQEEEEIRNKRGGSCLQTAWSRSRRLRRVGTRPTTGLPGAPPVLSQVPFCTEH